jgi:site-specific DNA-cytosine methylase
MEKLNVLGVMGGNGVCLYPFLRSKRFNILGNWEIRPVFYDRHTEQWQSNFQDIPQHREFRQYKNVDVIIGHPDCGDSSILRMSRAKVKGVVADNKSITGFITAVKKFKPKYFLLENLPGFLDTYSIEDLGEAMGGDYAMEAWVESVSIWGNSQRTRKRLVIIGSLIETESFKLPKNVELKYSEFFELGPEIREDICHVRESMDKTANLTWEGYNKIPYRTAEYIWNTQYAGKSRWHVGGKMNNQPGVTRNLPGTFPTTVRKQNRQFGTEGLVLSPREMANIQGVPQDFKLVYHSNNDVYWLNKARTTVTKTMPYEIAHWFKRCLVRSMKRD